jgi:hypothetical protein
MFGSENRWSLGTICTDESKRGKQAPRLGYLVIVMGGPGKNLVEIRLIVIRSSQHQRDNEQESRVGTKFLAAYRFRYHELARQR